MDQFKTSTPDELILHALCALKKSASDEGELKGDSVEIGIVGKDKPFTQLASNAVMGYLDKMKDFKGSS